MIILRNLFISLTITSFFFIFNNLQAAYGKGELQLSPQIVNAFYNYLTSNKGKPLRFAVSEDGQWAHWFYCAHPQCVSEGDTELVKLCERGSKTPCSTFAVGRSIKWKNGINPGGKDASFSKNITIDEVRDRLVVLGFFNNENKKKTSDTNKTDITKRLESLISLYEKGLLTEDEFKKAKEKLFK